MAQLIKLKNQPQKWLLKKQLGLINAQQIIPLATFLRIERKRQESEAIIQAARSDIQAFLIEKDHYYRAGFLRGIRKYQRQLIREVILVCAGWVRYIEQESKAIQQIAIKIGEKITHKMDISFDNINIDQELANSLLKMLSINILLPSNRLENIKQRYNKVAQLFDSTDFFISHQNSTGARLRLSILQTSCALDFDDRDLDRILGFVLHEL